VTQSLDGEVGVETAMISKIIHFFRKGVWEIRLKDVPPFKAFAIRCLRVILLALNGFMNNGDQKTASVLTYYSLLNLVPLIGVAFGISKGFGLEKMIEKQILQMAEKANWQSDITSQILGFSQSLLENAKGGLIAGVGVIMLFYTVISILGKIEESFNTIWEVRRPRTLVRKFTDYLTMMVLAPILFIISSSMTVLVASQVKVIVQKIALLGAFSSVIFFCLNLFPYLSIWILFTVLYVVMPNTRVRLRSGILGGIAAGTIYQVVQWIYIRFQIGVTNYGAIYGSFAALPLLLVWLQLSWTIVLFGSEISYADGHYETFGFHPDYSRISNASKKVMMLRIFHLLVKRFSQGEKPLTLNEIAYTVEIPIRLARELLSEMMEVGFVTETLKGSSNEIVFQPGRSIEQLTIQHVIDAYERRGETGFPTTASEEAEKISNCLKEISEAIEKSPANVRLTEI
jgi:membrane protein